MKKLNLFFSLLTKHVVSSYKLLHQYINNFIEKLIGYEILEFGTQMSNLWYIEDIKLIKFHRHTLYTQLVKTIIKIGKKIPIDVFEDQLELCAKYGESNVAKSHITAMEKLDMIPTPKGISYL